MSTLYLNGVIHSVSDPYATAVIVEDGMISWVGADDSADRMLRATGASTPETVDLAGTLLAPAFVDSWSTADADTPPAGHGVFFTAGPGATGHQVSYRTVTSATEIPTDDDATTGWALTVAGQNPPAGSLAPTQALEVLRAATERGTQVVLDARDQAAADALITGVAQLGQDLGTTALGRTTHRLVWNGALNEDQIQVLSTHGVSVTVVPDAEGVITTPVGALLAAGVIVSWGSGDAAPNPWGAVRALLEHAESDQRISARGGFTVTTRSGLRVLPAGSVDPQAQMAGRLAPSSPATFAIWEVESLSVQAPDGRVSAWSTDTRAGTPLLPVLDAQTAAPVLVSTVVSGTTVHGAPQH